MSEFEKHFLDQFWYGEGWPPFQYLFNAGVGLSQNLSWILGGDPDETISSRLGKAQRAGKPWAVKFACPLVDFLIFNEKDHCLKSIEDDEGIKEVWHWVKKKENKNADESENIL